MKKLLYSLLISLAFVSIANAADIDITSWKDNYPSGNSTWIEVKNKPNNYTDWVGIYPKNSDNSWNNVVAWSWARDTAPDTVDPGDWYEFTLEDGDYEARFFLNNTYVVEDKVSFSVGLANTVDITSWKDNYPSGNSTWIEVKNKPNNYTDWVGIYPKNSDNSWNNVVAWSWARDTAPDTVDPGDWYEFTLEDGNYEARFFLNNTYVVEDKVSFKVGSVDPVDNFGEKGNHAFATIKFENNLLNNNTYAHYPTDLNGQSAPVVIVAQGGKSKYNENKFITLMNFIASHGYYALYTDVASYGAETSAMVNNFKIAITELKNSGHNIDTSKVGVFGLSSGASRSFGILHKLKAANIGKTQSFILANDTWAALGVTKTELRNLSDNTTNIVILQNGVKGNEPKDGFGGDYTTDSLFPLTIYALLKQQNHLDRLDYQVFEGAGFRGHLYAQDNSVVNGVLGQNYEEMIGVLKPLGALIELTFNGTESARNIALESGSDNPVSDGIQEILNKDEHAYPCDKYTDDLDIDYCAMSRNNPGNL